MTPETAAARLSLALLPVRAFEALDAYAKFAREVHAEAGPAVLAEIVRNVEQHAPLTRRAA